MHIMRHKLQKELGEGLASLGAIRSAMDMFTRLNLWEDVVHCHVMLEEPKKAETLVTQLLQTSPKSPKLHCMLGDIRKEPMYYEMAWELSGGRFSRAMRSLGVHYWKEEKVACRAIKN